MIETTLFEFCLWHFYYKKLSVHTFLRLFSEMWYDFLKQKYDVFFCPPWRGIPCTSGHAVTVYGPWFKSIQLCDKRHILVGSCGAQTYGLCRLTDNAARSFAVGVRVSAGVHKCSLDASVRIYSMNERITFDCKCFLFIFYFLFNYFLAERKVDDVGSWRVMKWLH